MSRVLQKASQLDRPGWIPAEITHGWDTNPYAYQTEEELMPGGGLHEQLLAYLMELLRATLKARGLMLLMGTFMLYRDKQGVKQRIAPDLLLMPFGFPLPSAYDLDAEPPPLCVAEVTSTKNHFRDLQQKVPFYLGLGIPFYLAIDAITTRAQLRKQIELHGWRLVDNQPCRIDPTADGSLALPAMGLRIRALGQRIISNSRSLFFKNMIFKDISSTCSHTATEKTLINQRAGNCWRTIFNDEATGELLCDSEQLNTALQAERQALEAERQAHLKTLEAYQVAEAEIARLRALLEKK